ncbi:MAG: hypothetical protein FJZ47_24130, partial [Candidatus Tectomicrobia bacterium]|nr:hypothetical protein [Candidatus Tectomicrobia bacterium]
MVSRASRIKATLCGDACVAYCFVSPRGDGLKIGVPVTPVREDATYKHAWQVIANYFQRQYGITWDPSGKDICRLCFVSWDPEAYYTPTTARFPVPPPAPQPLPSTTIGTAHHVGISGRQRDRYAQQALQTAIRLRRSRAACQSPARPPARHIGGPAQTHAGDMARYLAPGLQA